MDQNFTVKMQEISGCRKKMPMIVMLKQVVPPPFSHAANECTSCHFICRRSVTPAPAFPTCFRGFPSLFLLLMMHLGLCLVGRQEKMLLLHCISFAHLKENICHSGSQCPASTDPHTGQSWREDAPKDVPGSTRESLVGG